MKITIFPITMYTLLWAPRKTSECILKNIYSNRVQVLAIRYSEGQEWKRQKTTQIPLQLERKSNSWHCWKINIEINLRNRVYLFSRVQCFCNLYGCVHDMFWSKHLYSVREGIFWNQVSVCIWADLEVMLIFQSYGNCVRD